LSIGLVILLKGKCRLAEKIGRSVIHRSKGSRSLDGILGLFLLELADVDFEPGKVTHILPNAFPPIVVKGSLDIGNDIINGFVGADTVDGGSGTDTIIGPTADTSCTKAVSPS